MSFDEQLELGRRWARAEKELRDNLSGLATDPRFPAVLGWLDKRRAEFAAAGAKQSMAPHHGALAHCAGSQYALDLLLDELRALYQPRAQGGLSPKE